MLVFTNHLKLSVYVMILSQHFSPRVILKPGSSGRSRTAPSPSHCLSPSWRGPSGKSSPLRLSTKSQKDYERCTVWLLSLAFSPANITLGVFQTTRKCCHHLSYSSESFCCFITYHHFPSSSSSHLWFAETPDSCRCCPAPARVTIYFFYCSTFFKLKSKGTSAQQCDRLDNVVV